jgi:hypothetical protein
MGQSDSGHLAVSSSGWVAGLIKPAQCSGWPRDEAEGKPERAGAYTIQRFNLSQLGRPTEESQGFKPDLGNPAVRDYRGASGTVAMVELGTHSATERAGMVTLHLQQARPSSIPTNLRIPIIGRIWTVSLMP